MEEHLKHGLIFAVVCAGTLLVLNMIALTGEEAAVVISNVVLVPFSWFWDLLGIPACQVMGHIVLLVSLVLAYYLIIGFAVGFLFSMLIEMILAKKAE